MAFSAPLRVEGLWFVHVNQLFALSRNHVYGVVTWVVALAKKDTTIDLKAIGARMKAAREALGSLSQSSFNEQYGYGSTRSFQKNESGETEGGMSVVLSFVEAGINANWLLTGQGPMRLAELAEIGAKVEIPAFLRRSAEPLSLVANEPPVAEYGAPVLDPHLLEAVTSALFSWIEEHKDVVRIDPSRYGALITVLYRWAANAGGLNADDLEQIMRAAA